MGDGAASPEKLSVIEPHSGPPIDERVAKLETNLSTLVDSIKSLAGTVSEGFAESRRDRGVLQEEHKRELRGVQQEISRERESRRPQYQTQAAWAAVVLTIVFGAWALTSKGYDRDQQRLEASLSELQTTRLQSSYERGVIEGRMAGLERGLERDLELAARNRSDLDQAIVRQQERAAIFEDLKGRVLALEKP